MPEDAKLQSQLNEFRGLSEKEIYRIMQANAIAIKPDTQEDIGAYGNRIATVRRLYRLVKRPLTTERMTQFAQEATAQGDEWIARQWWREVHKEGAPSPLRALTLASQDVSTIQEEFNDVTKKEWIEIARRFLDDHDYEEAFLAYQKAEETDLMCMMFEHVIDDEGFDVSERMIKVLAEALPKTALRKCVRRFIIAGDGLDDDFISYLRKKHLTDLFPLVFRTVLGEDEGYGQLMHWEERLKMKAGRIHLERAYRYYEKKEDVCWMVKFAERLAKEFPQWRRRLPRIYVRAREFSLTKGEIRQAARYATLSQQPLTLQEITPCLLSKHIKESACALQLATKLIMEALRQEKERAKN